MIILKKSSLGFTLIELLITVSIVVLMALVAVPTFSSYQKRSQFAQSTSEVNDYLNQYGLLAKNPELGVTCYRMIADSDDLMFLEYSTCDLNSPVSPLSNKKFNKKYFGDDTVIAITTGLRCETKSGNCFFTDSSIVSGTKTKILTITDKRVKKSAEYWVTDQPFSVELKINDI